MKVRRNIHKREKKADRLFRFSISCFAACLAFCALAKVCEKIAIGTVLCFIGAGLTLLAGLFFLCMAQGEGTEPYLREPEEELEEEELEELKKRLETEREKYLRG